MCHDHYYYNSQICSGSSTVDSVSEYCCFDLHALLDKWGILIHSWLKWNIIPALFKCQHSFVALLHLISSVEITRKFFNKELFTNHTFQSRATHSAHLPLLPALYSCFILMLWHASQAMFPIVTVDAISLGHSESRKNRQAIDAR